MANWSVLKAAVADVIKTNGNNDITGQELQDVLNSIISNVGANGQFIGIATEATTPGTPDGYPFYIIPGNGIYSNFGLTVTDNKIRTAKYNGTGWDIGIVNTYSSDYMDTIEISAGKKLSPIVYPLTNYGTTLTRNQIVGFFIDVELVGFDTSSKYYGGCYIDADNKRVQVYEVTSAGVIVNSSDPDRFYSTVAETKNNLTRLSGSGGYGSAKFIVDWSKIPSTGTWVINMRFNDIVYSTHEGFINDWSRLKTLQDFQAAQTALNATFALKTEIPDVSNLALKSEIVYYEEAYSSNLYDFDTASLTSGFILSATGSIGSSTPGTYHPSPFIPWREATQIMVGLNGSVPSTGAFSALQYDENYEPIAASWTGTSAGLLSLTKYSGAVYFRITMREGQQNQLNYGTSVLAYEAYYLNKIYQKDSSGNPVYFKPNTNDTLLNTIFALKSEIPGLGNYTTNVQALKLFDFISGLWQNKTILHVKHPTEATDNVVYFDTIIDAVDSITDASQINPYEVQIWSDISVNQSADFQTVPDSTYKAICYVKNGVTLRGMGQQKTIHAELPDDFATSVELYETMHFDGGGSIENLKITGYNVRYPIHYERAMGIIGQNQNTKSIIRNCHIEHLGCYSGLTVPWTAQDAWGCGTGQGLIIDFVNTIIIGSRHGIRVHNNRPFLYPNRISLERCRVYGNPSNSGNAIQFDDYSSGAANEFEINNTDVQGRLIFTETSGVYTSKQCIPIPKISGGGNNTIYYAFGANTPIGLKIVSDTTGVNSSVTLVDDSETDIIGKAFLRKGNIGISAWLNGDECLTATDYTLADRLGDCSITNKTLIINIDGTDRNIVFNEDFSAQTNTYILAFVNTALSGYAVASFDHPIRYYYPEFSNVLFLKKYTGSTLIPKGTFIKFTGLNQIRELVAGEKPDGFLLDDVSENEFARVLNNSIVLNSGNFSPLFYSTSTFSEGDKFTIQDGKLIIDSNSEFDIVAISSTYIKIKL